MIDLSIPKIRADVNGVIGPQDYHAVAIAHTMFVDTIGGDETETILEHLQSSTAMVRVAQLRVLSGSVARVMVEATAFAQRQSCSW